MLSCAVLALSFAAPPSNVVVLDSDNFDRMTKEGVWFIKFYAPWCGHCKRMAPVWEQLAKKLEGSGIRVAKVDADGETEIGEKFHISHYPTLKILEGLMYGTGVDGAAEPGLLVNALHWHADDRCSFLPRWHDDRLQRGYFTRCGVFVSRSHLRFFSPKTALEAEKGACMLTCACVLHVSAT